MRGNDTPPAVRYGAAGGMRGSLWAERVRWVGVCLTPTPWVLRMLWAPTQRKPGEWKPGSGRNPLWVARTAPTFG